MIRKKTIINIVRDLWHLFVASYAAFLVLASVFTPRVTAQDKEHDGPSPYELERRIDTVEKQNLDHRITIIETTLSDLVSNFSWYRVTSGGTGLLLAEAVYRHAKKKKEEEPSE